MLISRLPVAVTVHSQDIISTFEVRCDQGEVGIR
jgi:hypothetical protein